MIKSLNRQDVKDSDYPPSSGPIDYREYAPEKLPYICDCCLKHITIDQWGAWDLKDSPRLVHVAGMIYSGCSSECARILFMIHQQYAMLDTKEEGRFVTDKDTGRTLDLDRVVMIETEPYAGPELIWVKFFLDPTNIGSYVGFVASRVNAEAYVNAWKSRRVSG